MKKKKESMTSIYKGVYYSKEKGKYGAQIYIYGTSYQLGMHESEKVCNIFSKKIRGFLKMYGEQKTIEYIKNDWKLIRSWIINK